jgi:hypothetical protein
MSTVPTRERPSALQEGDSLDHFLRGRAPRFEQALDDLKEDWQRLDRSSDAPLGYESMVGKADGSLGDRVSDKQLAYTWVYCDLVHADDDASERVGAHDIDSRFQAGTILIASAAVRVIATLNLVRQMRQNGLLTLTDELFSQRVNARPGLTLPLAAFVLAPVQTPLEEMERLLDAAGGTADSSAAEAEEP